MSKQADIEDLLGGETKPTKKTAAKKTAPAKTEPAAKKAPAKKAAVKEEAEVEAPAEKAKRVKEPIRFDEGERQTITDGVTAHFKRSKKPINSKDLAEKLGTETRKLRLVLYALQSKGSIVLESGASKVAGMTVSPA